MQYILKVFLILIFRDIDSSVRPSVLCPTSQWSWGETVRSLNETLPDKLSTGDRSLDNTLPDQLSTGDR